MSFVTPTFLVFLATVFCCYWIVAKRTLQNAILLLASYAFYAWWDYRFCALMLVSSLVDFFVGRALDRTERQPVRKLLLATSIVVNLGLLGFFKYFNFFSASLTSLLHTLGFSSDPILVHLILPLGISFYTFQTLSYSIDVYRRKLPAASSILDYMAYVAFFPQLVAGPIERATRLLPQFQTDRTFDPAAARDGLRQVLWGFMKKMALADNLGVIVDKCYSSPGTMSGPNLSFATLCFALQIYYDFSAYSDIATGVARLFGFNLMRNFAYPYFSQTVGEFWRRWHISLTTWFRDYIYIPLGGSRAGKRRLALSIMLTFIISGLWHGASWNFIVWGAFSGLVLLPSALWGTAAKAGPDDIPCGSGSLPGFRTCLRVFRTFLIVCVGWVLFRAQTLGQAFAIFRKIAADALKGSVFHALSYNEGVLMILVLFCFACEWAQRRYPHPLVLTGVSRPIRWILYTLLIWATFYLGAVRRGEFIYFQF